MKTFKKHKVLLIDDDRDDLELMQDIFEKEEKADLVMISSGKQVISCLDSIHQDEDLPELILTDYFLPGITGAEILKDLKAHWRYSQINVLVYSSSYIKSIITICEGLGARGFLQKPATIPEYRDMMYLALGYLDTHKAR